MGKPARATFSYWGQISGGASRHAQASKKEERANFLRGSDCGWRTVWWSQHTEEPSMMGFVAGMAAEAATGQALLQQAQPRATPGINPWNRMDGRHGDLTP